MYVQDPAKIIGQDKITQMYEHESRFIAHYWTLQLHQEACLVLVMHADFLRDKTRKSPLTFLTFSYLTRD